jgi:excinuclease UvrABC nuclease subunit
MIPGKWYRFTLSEGVSDRIPDNLIVPGTYAIFDNHGHLLYIGQSGNLRARLMSHIQPARYSSHWVTRFGRFKTLTVAVRQERFKWERLANEKRMIQRLSPPCNQEYCAECRGMNGRRKSPKQLMSRTRGYSAVPRAL